MNEVIFLNNKIRKEEVAKEDASKSFDNKTLEETDIKDVDISADETETNTTQDELLSENKEHWLQKHHQLDTFPHQNGHHVNAGHHQIQLRQVRFLQHH
mgnify:CR=1 FL=1